ncbi:MAG TPA: hypothetical protein VE422_34480 [Terriglobia bacterium]|nr:hypothetical protein [Terriglobia bacterium]
MEVLTGLIRRTTFLAGLLAVVPAVALSQQGDGDLTAISLESLMNVQVYDIHSFKSSYSLLRMQLHASPAGSAGAAATEGQNPQHQFYVGTFLKLPKSFEISAHTYAVSSLPNFQIPSYARFDLNLGWKATENVSFKLAGQNLLGSHKEFGDLQGPANVIRPSVYGSIAWTF